MTIGAGGAQLVAWLTVPILTRLYSPSDWGTSGLIFTTASLLAVMSSLRYEQSIVLPKTKSRAAQILKLCIAFATFFFIFNMFLASILWLNYRSILFELGIGHWCFIAPILGLTISLVNIFSNAAVRESKFNVLSLAIAAQQTVNAVVAIMFGIFFGGFWGLLIAKAVSTIVSLIVLSRQIYQEIFCSLSRRSVLIACAIIRKYRRFPKYSLPNSLLSIVSKDAIVLLVGLLGDQSSLGMLVLARIIIYSPASMLSSILGPVFLKEFSDNLKKKRSNDKAVSLSWILFVVGGCAYLLFGLNAEFFVIFIFGVMWQGAENIFIALLPAGFLLLFNSWFDRIFEVRQKTHIALNIQIFFDTLMLCILCFLAFAHFSPETIVFAYAIILFMHNLAYFFVAKTLILQKIN